MYTHIPLRSISSQELPSCRPCKPRQEPLTASATQSGSMGPALFSLRAIVPPNPSTTFNPLRSLQPPAQEDNLRASAAGPACSAALNHGKDTFEQPHNRDQVHVTAGTVQHLADTIAWHSTSPMRPRQSVENVVTQLPSGAADHPAVGSDRRTMFFGSLISKP